ncbi:MAG: hypothetical protein WC273_02265 [Dehalococcoidia bacterium]
MADGRCDVCGVEAEPVLLHACFRCDAKYHLNPYSNVDGIDCGDAVLGPEEGLFYYCAPCLDEIDREFKAFFAGIRKPVQPPERPATAGSPPRRRFRRIDR